MDHLERLLTPRQVAELEGCSLTTASVAGRRESLPKAKYGLRKGTFGIPSKAEAAA